RPPQARKPVGAHRHGRRHHHDAGDLPLPADRHEFGWACAGPVRGGRGPAALPLSHGPARHQPANGAFPARHEVRIMSDDWLKALILATVFGAVILAVDTIVSSVGRGP